MSDWWSSDPVAPTARITVTKSPYDATINDAATQNGISPELLRSLIKKESNFNPNAVSSAGAIGLAQFMPGTARELGVDPNNAEQSIAGAAKYLAQNRDRFGGDMMKALAAYNWGPGNVAKWNGDVNALPAETRNYVQALAPKAAPQSGADWWSNDPVANGPSPVESRFGTMQQPSSGAPQLASALKERAPNLSLGRQGTELSPSAQMAIEQRNMLEGISQGTSPHVSTYGGRLVSADTYTDDAGNIQYRDPQTGELKYTNNATQVALTDPVDQTTKVFWRSPQTNESPLTGTARVLAGGYLTGAPTKMATLPHVVPKASDLLAAAKPAYQAFDKAAAEAPQIAPEITQQYAQRIKDSVSKFPSSVRKEIEDTASEVGSGPITLNGLKDAREKLSESLKAPDARTRRAAGIARDALDKVIGENSPAALENLQKGNAAHAAGQELASYEDLQNKAGLREGRKLFRANTGERLRTMFTGVVERADKALIKNPEAGTRVPSGFSPDIVEAMRDYIHARRGLRYSAEMSPTKGILRTFMEVAAISHFGPAAGLVPAAGYVASKAAKILDARDASRINELIAKRSPAYAEAVAKALNRYLVEGRGLLTQTTPNKLAAFLSASRSLASGLTRDGVKITAGDLVRRLTSAVPSPAEDNQGPIQGPSGQ